MSVSTQLSSTVTSEPSRSDEPLHEVVNGQRVELPPMSLYAAVVASRLQMHLGAFVEQHGLGFVVTEGLFILGPVSDTRRRPDRAFVSTTRLPAGQTLPLEGDGEVIPDLAVEVVSPNDRAEELQEKVVEYFTRGVAEAWVIYPKIQQLFRYVSLTQVSILTAVDTLNNLPRFPGFQLVIGSLFPPRRTSPSSNGAGAG